MNFNLFQNGTSSTGFPKIYRAMRNNGSPDPGFKTDDLNQYFLAGLPIHPAFVVGSEEDIIQKTTQNLTSNQQAILDYIQNNPEATRKDIAEAISDISEDGVKYNLARLQDLGIIKRVGGRKQGYWEIILK